MRFFYRVADLIKDRLRDAGIQGTVAEKTAAVLWPDVVGEKTASVTRVDRVRDGIVYVTCADSMWAQELHFLKNVIIEKLNERLDGAVIKDIRLSGRGFRKRAGLSGRADGEENEPEKPRKLSEKEIERVESAVKIIEDEALAAAVGRGILAALAAHKPEDDSTESKRDK